MSLNAWGEPPQADDRESDEDIRPIEVWGIAVMAPTQRISVDRHCFGDCGKISMGGAIDDAMTGGLFVCSQPICPFEAKVIRDYGSTMSFGKPHTVHLRALKEETE